MNRLILTVLLLFLTFPVLPVKSEFDWDWKSIKSLFGFDEKEYMPTGINQAISTSTDTSVDSVNNIKRIIIRESVNIDHLNEVKLNTTEWKCIEKILRNSCDNPKNITSLLLIATKETTIDQIKGCYAIKEELVDPNGWWNDSWNFISENYVYIIASTISMIVVIISLYKLCYAVCKKKRDEDFIE